MNIDALREGLVNCLEQFDTDILPLGLYASDELVETNPVKSTYQEWKRAIFPFLASKGGSPRAIVPSNNSLSRASCTFAALGSIEIALVKISNIKVRKYGSGYQVDKQEDRLGRWEKADLEGQISQMWTPRYRWSGVPKSSAHIVLFIGYDKTQRPFERELNELRESGKWENRSVAYQSQIWQDKAGRGFNIRLCAWSRPADL